MGSLPQHEIVVYHTGDTLPPEVEELFATQLADARCPLPEDRRDRDQWGFALVCAIASGGYVLGGVHLDIGPIGGAGPLARRKLACLQRTFVRPEYRRRGLASRLLHEAIQAGREAGCLYIRCSNDWDDESERRLFLKCGFALVDLNGAADNEPCYLAVRPLPSPEVP
jgi:GNAT superfamily N-acetyltransferase